MVRRRRRVGKTTQIIRFIRFILVLASVTSNNHTHMVFADVMSTSFADKLCLHISTPSAYMTAPSLSWYRLVVFRVLHSVFFRIREKSAHDYCCFMFLGSVENLYRTNCVTRSCAILSKSIFFLSSSQADLCTCCLHIWPMHLLQQCWSCHCPSASCSLYCVPCTHLIQHVYCGEN